MLLSSRQVEQIKTKYKIKKFYAITPVGIAVLFQHGRIHGYDKIKRVIEILNFYSHRGRRKNFAESFAEKGIMLPIHNAYDKLLEPPTTLEKSLSVVFAGIRIHDIPEGHEITVSYSVDRVVSVNFYRFIIKKGKIYDGAENDLVEYTHELDNDYCFSRISNFVINATIYHTVTQFYSLGDTYAAISDENTKKLKKIINVDILSQVHFFNWNILSRLNLKTLALESIGNLTKNIEKQISDES
jgi:hypothetical protein